MARRRERWMWIQPKKGVEVRHPVTNEPLPPEGKEVIYEDFARAVRSGDASIVDPPPPPAPISPPEVEAKEEESSKPYGIPETDESPEEE